MHEFGVTESIIKNLLTQLEFEKVTRVTSVHFQRSSAFSEDVLSQTFAVLSAGNCLEGADLIVDVNKLTITCECGQVSEVNSDDLVGHMYICPSCGIAREIAEAHDLELLSVTAETEDESNPDGIRA